jgi:hypothetical protein
MAGTRRFAGAADEPRARRATDAIVGATGAFRWLQNHGHL